jgi:hypothetical protein
MFAPIAIFFLFARFLSLMCILATLDETYKILDDGPLGLQVKTFKIIDLKKLL